jgi:hypothetical protein
MTRIYSLRLLASLRQFNREAFPLNLTDFHILERPQLSRQFIGCEALKARNN